MVVELKEFVEKNIPEGRVLILSPHDDDAIIGCGGLLNTLKKRASVAVLTDGALGSADCCTREKETIIVRRREAGAAYKSLGVSDIEFFGFPDMCLNQYECWKTEQERPGTYQKAIHLLRRKMPTSVFIPSSSDFHPDHKATSRIGTASIIFSNSKIAFFKDTALSRPTSILAVWTYYVWSRKSDECVLNVSLSKEASTAKTQAISCFESQQKIVDELEGAGLMDTRIEKFLKEALQVPCFQNNI